MIGRLKAVLPLVCALALAGCGGEAPVPDAAREDAARQELAGGEEELPVMGPPVRILAFGDSLFAGYNVEQRQSYPAVLQNVLRRRGINARVVNAGVSGDTTQAGRQRLAFTLDNQAEPPDLAIVELGGNDLLRGLPPAETRRNLVAIMEELEARDIPVLLMGMRAPPNLGADFVAEFDAIYPDLAERFDAALVPFFLEPVYDRPALIQPDRVHPTAKGIEIIVAATADEVARALPEAPDAAE